MPKDVTYDEIQRVRRHECSMLGHSWDVMEAVGRGPVMIICSNCGESHRVVSEEREYPKRPFRPKPGQASPPLIPPPTA